MIFKNPKFIIAIASLTSLAFVAGFMVATTITHSTQPEINQSEVTGQSIISLITELGYDDNDNVELLMSILALEHAAPTLSRSYGFQIGNHAERYISASRKLTDIQVTEHYPDELPRVIRLREATEKFMDALPGAAMTHRPIRSGYARETRVMLIPLERLVREEMVGGDGLVGDFDREVEWAQESPSISISKLEGYILAPDYVSLTGDKLSSEDKAELRAQRKALIATLPELQAALHEWPPEFSKKYEAHLDHLVKSWFSKE